AVVAGRGRVPIDAVVVGVSRPHDRGGTARARARAASVGQGDGGARARRDRPPSTARTRELPRFIATALPLGYAWLVVGALFMVGFDGVPTGWRYDAMVHALFAGFALTMIFAHGPIVIPAVIGGAIAYRPILYGPLALLEVSVLLRVAGDALERAGVRDAGAIGTAIALVGFMAAMATGI